ncbi:MAG TPA: hypothetical protein VNT60_11205 [Deinococcales bacterium]|nr:hypothetical protein [Deinococcales bacterium]
MARISILVLVLLAAVGVIFAMLPSPPPRVAGNVRMEDTKVVLFPEADRDARWTFQSSLVTHDPDSRESVVQGDSKGIRWVKGKVDLTLKARDITVDANENLRVQTAVVEVPSDCITMNLGQEGAAPVYIDQVGGYRAPRGEFIYPDMRVKSDALTASFDLESMDLTNAEYEMVYRADGTAAECVNGRIVEPEENK